MKVDLGDRRYVSADAFDLAWVCFGFGFQPLPLTYRAVKRAEHWSLARS